MKRWKKKRRMVISCPIIKHLTCRKDKNGGTGNTSTVFYLHLPYQKDKNY